MHDNECWEPGQELEKAIKALAKAWRDMLRRSDAELGIDAEYTRPGIEALLGQLQDHFECCEAAEVRRLPIQLAGMRARGARSRWGVRGCACAGCGLPLALAGRVVNP